MVRRLNAAIRAALTAPDTVSSVAVSFMEPMPTSPEQLGTLLGTETDFWARSSSRWASRRRAEAEAGGRVPVARAQRCRHRRPYSPACVMNFGLRYGSIASLPPSDP